MAVKLGGGEEEISMREESRENVWAFDNLGAQFGGKYDVVPIDADSVAPEDGNCDPNFPLSQPGLDVMQLDLVSVRHMSPSRSGFHRNAIDDEFFLFLLEEFGFFRAIWQSKRHY